MKKFKLRTKITNRSRFPINTVWENAQDLEHVGFLHSRTNRQFHLLYSSQEPGSLRPYDFLAYRTVRRLYFWGIQTFGFRRIVTDYQLQQYEYLPLLGITTTLNSLLYATGDSKFPTEMVDEVVLEIPFIFAPLKKHLVKALHRHATIQCAEDEPYRERREELARRGIRFPFSLFKRTHWIEMTEAFRMGLQEPTNFPKP